MDYAGCRSTYSSRTARAQHHHNDDAVCHFAHNHAARQIIETQQLEAKELTGEKQAKGSIEADCELMPASVTLLHQCPGRGSNPYAPCGAPDFKGRIQTCKLLNLARLQ
jgi:hypothetical protein